MRQLFLCAADGRLEAGDFMLKNWTLDRLGEEKKCRDWKMAADWVDQEFEGWLIWNGLSLADLEGVKFDVSSMKSDL